MAHTRYMTEAGMIVAIKIDRALNVADLGTHYSTRDVLRSLEYRLRNHPVGQE